MECTRTNFSEEEVCEFRQAAVVCQRKDSLIPPLGMSCTYSQLVPGGKPGNKASYKCYTMDYMLEKLI